MSFSHVSEFPSRAIVIAVRGRLLFFVLNPKYPEISKESHSTLLDVLHHPSQHVGFSHINCKIRFDSTPANTMTSIWAIYMYLSNIRNNISAIIDSGNAFLCGFLVDHELVDNDHESMSLSLALWNAANSHFLGDFLWSRKSNVLDLFEDFLIYESILYLVVMEWN